MRFGWLSLSLSPCPDQDNNQIHQIIHQVEEAESLGFKDVWLTEHYFTGESVYNDAIVFASALAMKTRHIRIGFAVVQMPFHHPVRLATQLALLDNLSNGMPFLLQVMFALDMNLLDMDFGVLIVRGVLKKTLRF